MSTTNLLSSLRPVDGAVKKRKRVGRGDASGHGGTSGRGHKGDKARSGSRRRAWFEGGQMPIYRRVPKRGFKSLNKVEYQIVNIKDIEKIEASEIRIEELVKSGLVKSSRKPVKILGDGELSRAVTIYANAFSKSAKEKIEKAGGKAEVV
ncbi:MAG: 50S ribosomal protein L15 [Candidatus Neomarinimicrobiota bacterium]|nr:MAG: 50S ribosomal protein L15 [Candidatus Neomarinimicrobiota bacterium]HDN59793.1 50S ribosomal protein L15 [Candidatus Neomarinimicrobiota bacterium]